MIAAIEAFFPDFLKEYWRIAHKVILHWLTGFCEIDRICSIKNEYHTSLMTSKFAASLKRSKSLDSCRKIIFSYQPFSVNEILEMIIEVKQLRISSLLLHSNISKCLDSLQKVNLVYSKLDSLKKQNFDNANTKDVETLESFWSNMKPNIRRNGGMVSDDWGELGFQGRDPTTDFRGMGMLGLVQLTHFSKKFNSKAQIILRSSMHPRRFYPFAATGINITKFVLDLLEQTRLHRFLFHALDSVIVHDDSVTNTDRSIDDDHIQFCCDSIHDIYCDVFYAFHVEWERQDPENIMQFSRIFSEVKNSFITKYQII